MADFDETRAGYRGAAQKVAAGRDALVAASERVRALEKQLEQVARRAAPATEDGGEQGKLRGDLRNARENLVGARAELFDANEALISAAVNFSVFADPVKGAGRLSDGTPIALFPLRIETRYKTIAPVGGAPHQQLWVRVFPDDILVDSFQPEISEAELNNLGIYWTHRWRAGKDPDGLRAAWLALAKAHGAGRAEWLIGQYAPVNADDEPEAVEGEYILVISTQIAVPATELADIAAYWARIWSSGGAAAQGAHDDLADALSQARADEVIATLIPANLNDVDVKPDPSITPKVHVLHLPDPAGLPVSAEDWTRGARAWMLPERLVVMGFRGGKQLFIQTGRPIPADLRVGPDPSDSEEHQVKADGPDIVTSEAMDWTVDFEAAVDKGMGFVVDLTERGLAPEFDRLFVLGLRLASDAQEGAAELETLIGHHQASRKGFTLLPQGQPTNNSEEGQAGYSWWEANDAAYDHFHPADPHGDPGDWRERRDGAWLAGLLGLDPKVLRNSPGYYGTDQSEARAMNLALWPATLGYYMEQMMEPVFSEETVRRTRDFFCRHVIGRGTTPLARIGRQPYGVLPATVWSRQAFWRSIRAETELPVAVLSGSRESAWLAGLHGLIERAVSIWSSLSAQVSHVGQPGPDPQQTLLDIIGLHPVSAEFYQRYSQSFTQYYNLLGFESDLVSGPVTAQARLYVEAGLLALADLGWTIPAEVDLPELLEKIFLKKANLLKGDLVAPVLSDSEGLPVDRADGLNYLGWLAQAARTSHDTLRKQEGFASGVPSALLYQMMRHALDLGYVDSGLQLRREALQWNEATYRAQRKEPKFLSIAQKDGQGSRWAPLYRAEQAVTGDAVQRLGDFIPSAIDLHGLFMAQQLAAVDRLAEAPTARLERAFVEHLDCLNYRLDAWRMGLLSTQLSHMRQETGDGFARRGLYLGAYGWVEDLKPHGETRQPVQLDPELAAVFNDAAAEPVMTDSSNFGHVHAPSLDQAVTAAIMRNGHLAHATPGAPDLLAVDLSSERVRLAQEVIEGMRNGQSLGALLGYRLERALHDEPNLFLDPLIYDLRRAFPLAGNRNRKTKIAALSHIRKVEARNVLDGAAFSRHIDETGNENYPYGISDLPPLSDFTGPGLPGTSEIGHLIDGMVATMRSIGDAVADLATAEGVYQVVRGNYDKAAGSLDAFSKGLYPPEVEVVSTPRSGHALTHRVGLHLEAALAPGAGGLTNPREQGEPALAKWLAAQLPDPATIAARVSWTKPDGTSDALTVTMQQLGLAPADLFYMIDAGGAREMAGFDELLIDFAQVNGAPAPRDDALFAVEYRPAGVAGTTLFELAPLVRSLRGFVMGARPLRATDLSLQNEASRSGDLIVIARTDKVMAVRGLLAAQRAPITTYVATLEGAIGEGVDPVAAADVARDTIDQWASAYAGLVRPLAPFGLRSSGLTAAIEGRRGAYLAMQKALGELGDRWTRYGDEYDAAMVSYGALPGTASDGERQALLLRAASLVSTTVITPLPATIAALEAVVGGLRGDFDTARGALDTMRTANDHVGDLLIALTVFLPTIAAHDLTPCDIAPFRASILALARDLLVRAGRLGEDVDARLAGADKALADAAAGGDKGHQALVRAQQAMLGQGFIQLPEFLPTAATLSEWRNAWADRSAILDHLTTPADGTLFPLDDWLNGVARVRERMRHLETAAMLVPVLGGAGNVNLAGVQFPYRVDDVWLGLDFPATFRGGAPFLLDTDKLLYTAHFAPGALIDPDDPAKNCCGLLVDEWVEVVPGTQETTGLSFHYDRPNSEAPQVVLLVTPPVHDGTWQWEDIVDTMHETLDLARLRAVEPDQLATSALGPLLPAILSSVTMFPITAMLNFAFNNDLHLTLAEPDSE
jgi:hypothetical protein